MDLFILEKKKNVTRYFQYDRDKKAPMQVFFFPQIVSKLCFARNDESVGFEIIACHLSFESGITERPKDVFRYSADLWLL